MTDTAAVAVLVGAVMTGAGFVALIALFVQWVLDAASIDPPGGSR